MWILLIRVRMTFVWRHDINTLTALLSLCVDHKESITRRLDDFFSVDMSKYFGKYHKVSNIRRNLVGNKIVDHSDVVGASPVGAAPTTSSFST